MKKLLLLVFIFLIGVRGYADLDPQLLRKKYEAMITNPYILLPYKGTYFLPFSYNDSPNHSNFEKLEALEEYKDRGPFTQYTEAEFQISILTLTNRNIFGTNFNTFLGYTHRSYWQMYNESWSRPFRETNYNPEIFGRYIFEDSIRILGFNLILYDVGIEHESNGQIQELSRSWNRIYGRVILHDRQTLLTLTLWHRLKERKSEDENPQMYLYRGYGSIDLKQRFAYGTLHLNLLTGTKKLSGELVYSRRWKHGIRLYSKWSFGYGISLQDYNHPTNRFGFGFSIGELFESLIADEIEE